VAPQQERDLIDVPNPEDIVNPHAPKFDPEVPKGETLIMPVLILYPEHATSDVVPEFVKDTTFGAHLALMFPPGQSSRQPWDRGEVRGRWVAGCIRDDQAG
jgi:small subunit ribosomal protein S7e